MAKSRFLQELYVSARAAGLAVMIENRCGILFLHIIDRDLGTIAMWPAFDGTIESAARYAMECFDHLQAQQSASDCSTD